MAKRIVVNGPALISIGAQGTSGSLSELGYAEDGVDIEIEYGDEPVFADSGGTKVPVDFQTMGKMARISFGLTVYDSDVLDSILLHGATGPGLEPAPGLLLGANSKMFRVCIAGPLDLPHRFFFCKLDGSVRDKLGTKRRKPMVPILAIPGVGASGSILIPQPMLGLPLYDRTQA
jgi:hypothetical protein